MLYLQELLLFFEPALARALGLSTWTMFAALEQNLVYQTVRPTLSETTTAGIKKTLAFDACDPSLVCLKFILIPL